MGVFDDYTYAQKAIRSALSRWSLRHPGPMTVASRDAAVEGLIMELVSDFPKLLLSDEDVTVKLEANNF